MLKKNILIPYEKYERLMAQTQTDNTDGQCISHTQHAEVNRDKFREYGFKFEKDKEDQSKANMSIDLQKGGGEVKFNATAGLNNDPPQNIHSVKSNVLKPNNDNESSLNSNSAIIDAPLREKVYMNSRGPPGKRPSNKKASNNNWVVF